MTVFEKYFSWIYTTAGAAAMVALVACQAEPKQAAPKPEKETVAFDALRDSMEAIAFLKMDSLCRYEPNRICELGLGGIVLGAPIRDAFIPDFPSEMITDSLDHKDGYVWVTRTFPYKQGRILVEGQYAPEDEANDVLLSNSLINRIRVETPEFATESGIRVGMTLGELKKTSNGFSWTAVSIPGYEAIQVTSTKARHYQAFVFADKGYKLAEMAEKGVIHLEKLPENLRIQYIILL